MPVESLNGSWLSIEISAVGVSHSFNMLNSSFLVPYLSKCQPYVLQIVNADRA